MPSSFRQSEILEQARQTGRVTVEGLAQSFDVTLQTIRRDLSELAEAGHLTRVHGGAVLRSRVANIGYQDRQDLNPEAKSAIARACAAQIPNDATILLNIGTTTEAVARALRDHKNLTVITNNLNVANILAPADAIQVIVTGGTLRRTDGGLIGELTNTAIAMFKPDIAIIGASAIDTDGDMLDYDLEEVHVSRTILNHARQSFLVTDSSKFTRQAPVRIGSMSTLDAVFTDAMPPALHRACDGWNTAVTLAPIAE